MDNPTSVLKLAARTLVKNPGFTAAVVLTLTLAIGANTAVFSVMNALLLRMLPIHDPNHLYTVTLVNGGTQPPYADGTGFGNTSFSYPVYLALRGQSRVLAGVAAHIPLGYPKVPIRYRDVVTERAGEEVSGTYFSMLGIHFALGSGFTPADEANHSPIVVISYQLWTDAFSRDSGAIGTALYIRGVPFTIVGVTAPPFYGVRPGSRVDFWTPLQQRPELNAWGISPTVHTLYGSPSWWSVPIVARLQPGVTRTQAADALQPVFWEAASEGVGSLDAKRWPAHLGFEPIQGIPKYANYYREPVEIMLGLVVLVLLIACTNIVLLILTRNRARQQGFVMRVALGAPVSALVWYMLMESVLLVAAGATLGTLLAFSLTKVLAAWARVDTAVSPDATVLLFTLGISVLSACVFGFASSWSVLSLSIQQVLRNTSTAIAGAKTHPRRGHLMVAFQIAMCFTLLVAASLSVKSLLNYKRQQLGMDAEKLLIFDLAPDGISTNEQALSFYRRVVDELKAIPGVKAVSLARIRPGSGRTQTEGGTTIDGVEIFQGSGSRIPLHLQSVGSNFFHTMGIPVLLGRDISDRDTPDSPPTAVVNEYFAQQYQHYLGNNPIGHYIGTGPSREIVGVVRNSKYNTVDEGEMPVVYYPIVQDDMSGVNTVEVRTDQPPMALVPEIQHVIHESDPNLSLRNPMTQAAQFAATYVASELFARLSFSFGCLAAVLVAMGLYGVVAYGVQRRTTEIGLRIALGARKRDVLAMILFESGATTLLGFFIGAPAAIIASRFLRTQLYQLNYMDAFSFSIATAITMLVALLATIGPACRAARIEPMMALRDE
jgi:predicted permease